jgi:hypothetical protein
MVTEDSLPHLFVIFLQYPPKSSPSTQGHLQLGGSQGLAHPFLQSASVGAKWRLDFHEHGASPFEVRFRR